MPIYIYYTKHSKVHLYTFKELSWDDIPRDELNSPNEETPAILYKDDNKIVEHWFVNGNYHRLSGPANTAFYNDLNIKYNYFWLNGVRFYKFEKWLEVHPNQDETFQVFMKLKYS